jgi:hypothetical protein
MIQTQLQPGTALSKYIIATVYLLNHELIPFLVFDNWRMMHGRTEFTGKRRMCGGYGMCQNTPKAPFNRSLLILIKPGQSIMMITFHGFVCLVMAERRC